MRHTHTHTFPYKLRRPTLKNFFVNLIPHTANLTTLGDLDKGYNVNLEVDVLARYIDNNMKFRKSCLLLKNYLILGLHGSKEILFDRGFCTLCQGLFETSPAWFLIFCPFCKTQQFTDQKPSSPCTFLFVRPASVTSPLFSLLETI